MTYDQRAQSTLPSIQSSYGADLRPPGAQSSCRYPILPLASSHCLLHDGDGFRGALPIPAWSNYRLFRSSAARCRPPIRKEIHWIIKWNLWINKKKVSKVGKHDHIAHTWKEKIPFYELQWFSLLHSFIMLDRQCIMNQNETFIQTIFLNLKKNTRS